MEYNNDTKLRNLKAISLRNLYFPLNPKDESSRRDISAPPVNPSPIKEDKLIRRKSLFEAIPQLGQLSSTELLQVNEKKLIDSFFTLHVPHKNEDVLIYVSEIVLSNVSPNFRSISLPSLLNANALRILLKIWCKTVQQDSWTLYHVYDIDLKCLWYIGDKAVDTENFFHVNSVILNLNNGYYTLPESLTIDRGTLVKKAKRVLSKHILPSYSFDSIRSLNSIIKSLRELTQTKNKISLQISESIDMLNDSSNVNNIPIQLSKLNIENDRLDMHIEKQTTTNDTIMSNIMSQRVKIKNIKQTINEELPSNIEMARNHIEIIESQVEPIHESLTKNIYPSIIQSLQDATLVLKDIICIENKNNSIKFTILGLEFPLSIKELLDICYYNNSDLANHNSGITYRANDIESHSAKTTQINACLSYIIQLMNGLSTITSTNLMYKMTPNGNHCFVIDAISSNHQKVLKYPLFYDQENTSKLPANSQIHGDRKVLCQNKDFEIGLSLLNKNLVTLLNDITDAYNTYYQPISLSQLSNNIPVDCLDNFLWNLQYLILFITAPTISK